MGVMQSIRTHAYGVFLGVAIIPSWFMYGILRNLSVICGTNFQYNLNNLETDYLDKFIFVQNAHVFHCFSHDVIPTCKPANLFQNWKHSIEDYFMSNH